MFNKKDKKKDVKVVDKPDMINLDDLLDAVPEEVKNQELNEEIKEKKKSIIEENSLSDDTVKGTDSLEEMLGRFKRSEIRSIISYIEQHIKLYKQFKTLDDAEDDRVIARFGKKIGEGRIIIGIHNANSLTNLAEYDCTMTISINHPVRDKQYYDKRAETIYAQGTANCKGLTLKEAEEFLSMIKIYYRSRL